MKALLFTLFLLSSVSAHALTKDELKSFNCPGPLDGTTALWLNQAVSGTASSILNMTVQSGVQVTVTGTAGVLDVYFSNSATSTFIKMYSVPIPGTYCLPKMANFMRVQGAKDSRPTDKITAYYNYMTSSQSVATISGTPLEVTLTATLNPLPTTDGTSYTSLTTATYVVTTHTATLVNGTSTAGASVPLQYFVTAAQGGAALKYDIRSATEDAPSVGWLREAAMYNATTTTTQVTGRWAPGHKLYLLSVGASDVTATVKLVR